MSAFTKQEFVARWKNTILGERQSYQIHFTELCDLVGHQRPTASGIDGRGNTFAFEYGVKKEEGTQGFADVFYENHFAIEYKAPGKYQTLDAARDQLLKYRGRLNNPPLLVVTDTQNWEIHTNFNNAAPVVHKFTNEDIANKESVYDLLRSLFHDPYSLNPRLTTEDVTKQVAAMFASIAEDIKAETGIEDENIAHFLTKLIFCLFAEDVRLLPRGTNGEEGIFAEIVNRTYRDPSLFTQYVQELFQKMASGGQFLYQRIPYFNGSLFDNIVVEKLSIEALGKLKTVAASDWKALEPAIVGTLFERSLTSSKRSQLGTHFTSREDILLIVEPVLMQPLHRQWELIRAEAMPLRTKLDAAASPKERIDAGNALTSLRDTMLIRLREIKVLDPACGSGNFLYVSLQLLMDMEQAVITDKLFDGLDQPEPRVHPSQMYGIEINPIAQDLASIVVWIGYIQWQQKNGYTNRTHREPILQALKGNIQRMDAIMNPDGTEPKWPECDVIVGNPPFLGTKKMRGELGKDYVKQLHALYGERIPGFSDLVCYWFEKARSYLEVGKVKRVGLLATNSIRLGENRRVLERIKETGDIFFAYSDRDWLLDGAAVNISIVGFDNGSEKIRFLDGTFVNSINADLTQSGFTIGTVKQLAENAAIAFLGDMKGGSFDIPNELAQQMLIDKNNDSGKKNTDVIKRTSNALDITDRWRNYWIIDFGTEMSLDEARFYRKPFEYVEKVVKPEREKGKPSRNEWWLHMRPGVSMRTAIQPLKRHIATPAVSKHRLFVWFESDILSNHAVVLIARDDDYFFGVLHSRLHEVWSLRMGTSLEDRPRYTPTTTFETFPFPWSPGKEDSASPVYTAIGAAAKQLYEERAAWLNPPGAAKSELRNKTLTKLYNSLQEFRKHGIPADPDDFAPRLNELHNALDKAVCDAYGWPYDILGDEEEILRRLLALNLERAASS